MYIFLTILKVLCLRNVITYAGTKYTSPVSSTFDASSSDCCGELIIPRLLSHLIADPQFAIEPLQRVLEILNHFYRILLVNDNTYFLKVAKHDII